MEAYPNVRVKSDIDNVWQRIKSKDNYTLDIGMKPTEAFMKFSGTEFLTFDGTTITITGDVTNTGDIVNNGLFTNTGYLTVGGEGGFSVINFNDANGDTITTMYQTNSNGTFTISNTGTATADMIFYAGDDLSFNAKDAVIFDSDTSTFYFRLLPSDDTIDHVVAIDDLATGQMYKRSVASINDALTATSGSLTVNGDLTITGDVTLSDTTWDDLRAPATAINPPGQVSDPDWDNTNGGWLFDPDGIEVLWIIMQLPHNWKEGTDLKPHIHWMPTTTNTGNVFWQIDYKWTNYLDTDAGTFSTLTVLDPGDGTALKHQIAAFLAMDGTDKTISSMISIKLSRLGNQGTDTYTGDALLKEFDIHYEIDGFGSDEEYTK